jgi:uncharacterized protein (TIGR02466 family)
MDREIFPLFSAPVYKNNTGPISIPDLNQLDFKRLPGDVWCLESKYVLNLPEFNSVLHAVELEIESYTRNILRVDKKIEFYITNSWINKHTEGDQLHRHLHNNSIISGVIYLETTPESGNIIFYRPNHSMFPYPRTIDLDVTEYNIYNCQSCSITPKNNDIILFPSSLEHSVEPNRTNIPRCCIAFNVFVRGAFGTLHKLDIK